MPIKPLFSQVAQIIRDADALIITAGAGMGVDSGLPDFRGNHGFWNAYPVYQKLGIDFIELANPEHFNLDPPLGWGFYGHRLNLYRETTPHLGFSMIQAWTQAFNQSLFVYTSNVDGQFQKAGIAPSSICELHGSIHYLQCAEPCCEEIWDNQEQVDINLGTMRAVTIPRCPHCQGVARPNVMMFGDCGWLGHRTEQQEHAFTRFLDEHSGKKIVVIEIGAGTAIASIRLTSEACLHHQYGATVIRINPHDSYIAQPNIGIRAPALAAIKEINTFLFETS